MAAEIAEGDLGGAGAPRSADPLAQRLHSLVGELWRAAVDAVDPSRLTMKAIGELPTPLTRALQHREGKLGILAVGKAALAMASSAEDALPRPSPPAGRFARGFSPPPLPFGLTVVKTGAPGQRPRLLEVREAGHPIPDERSVDAGTRALAMLERLGERDVAVVLLSGGASALLSLPPKGVTLEDVREATRLCARAGLPIAAINAVRKHLSRSAGGALARAAYPALCLTFVISDVPGNRLDTIGSGPTVPDPTTFEDALRALSEAGVRDKVTPGVLAYLERGVRGEVPETIKAGDPCFARARTFLCGSNRNALDAAAVRARQHGYRPFVLEDELIGEARAVGRAFGKKLREISEKGKGPVALIAGGETTVRVLGSGEGGRNQELAIGAAQALDGVRGVALLACGTDGEDGFTDAAGALVDGGTAARARALGIDLEAALAANDSYPALDKLGALVRTGLTGTNVMDVAIGLVT